MATRSVVQEVKEIALAIELIELGARLQLLEAETSLSRERLVRLYKEVKGESPPKGMLPFSTDWFMTWQPNVHSSLFYNTYCFMTGPANCEPVQALVKSYRLYLEHWRLQEAMGQLDDAPVLSLTRAWTLVRYFSSGLLQMTPCVRCGGRFVAHAHDPQRGYVCGLCQPPSRAGRTRRAALAEQAADRTMPATAEFAPEPAREAITGAMTGAMPESIPEATTGITTEITTEAAA
ncbi:flagellar transcriptional regulator FlhC [Paraburkholderia acidisoli]|uniref:Flagellar transcriptional regulator FlhC n=1 Tax=Paraburkholderia acidisoli TaxID=2571748 RepID=A0A7Z2JGQ5_9BURK|nr:flagellar transcriptional regulator FlhC [Paraburkholderia acidisoli]QGZ62694.1 flagellar transcriptional regulator FlhC [Paraburkholderia acidisoli]